MSKEEQKKEEVIKKILLSDCIALFAVCVAIFIGLFGLAGYLFERRLDCQTELNSVNTKLEITDSRLEDARGESEILTIELKEKREKLEQKDSVIKNLEKKEREKERTINNLELQKIKYKDRLKYYEKRIAELEIQIKSLNDSIRALNEERQEYVEEIRKLEKKLINEMNKSIVYARKSKVIASISNISIKGNNLQYTLIFTKDDIPKIKKIKNDKLELLTKLELVRNDGTEIIMPVFKENNQLKQDIFDFNAGYEYPMIFEIPKEIAKNYRNSIYETKTTQRNMFRLTIYCGNLDNSQISQRIFYLSEK